MHRYSSISQALGLDHYSVERNVSGLLLHQGPGLPWQQQKLEFQYITEVLWTNKAPRNATLLRTEILKPMYIHTCIMCLKQSHMCVLIDCVRVWYWSVCEWPRLPLKQDHHAPLSNVVHNSTRWFSGMCNSGNGAMYQCVRTHTVASLILKAPIKMPTYLRPFKT